VGFLFEDRDSAFPLWQVSGLKISSCHVKPMDWGLYGNFELLGSHLGNLYFPNAPGPKALPYTLTFDFKKKTKTES